MSIEKKNSEIISRSDLANTMKEKYGVSLKDAKSAINMVTETIIQLLRDTDKPIQLTGFGTFEKRFIAERQGKDFQSGGEITIPAHNRVVFRTGAYLKKL